MQLFENTSDSLGNEEVRNISIGSVYFVHSGRNTWYGTWSVCYYDGCMHTTLESARKYAESKRKRGTVLYIKQLPCFIFRSRLSTLLITQINESEPFSKFSPDNITNFSESTLESLLGLPKNPLKNGNSIAHVAQSFISIRSFWNPHPLPFDSVILLSHNSPFLQVEQDNLDNLKSLKAFRESGIDRLLWERFGEPAKSTSIQNLYRTFSRKTN